jgi:hypothetical protein
MARSLIDYFVIEAICFDVEQLDDIVAYLNGEDSEWQDRSERPALRPEVLAALMRLVRDKLVTVHLENANGEFVEGREGVWPARPIAEMYFALTGRGQVVFLNWDS